VSVYDTTLRTVVHAAATRTGGREIDVLQSALVLNDSLLLVVSNNTNELILFDRATLKETRSFRGSGSPRYAVLIGATKILVSDLYAGQLLELDWATGARDSLRFSGQSEQMIRVSDAVYVCGPEAAALFQYSIREGELVDSLQLGYPVTAIAQSPSPEGLQFVLAAGVASSADQGAIQVIDWTTKVVANTLLLDQEASSLYPRVSVAHNRVLVLHRGLYAVDSAGDITVLDTDLGLAQPYALGVDPAHGDIYVGDAGSLFSGAGTVVRYSSTLSALDTFEAGVLPGGFVF